MRASRPSRSNYASPRRPSPLPPTASCQHKAGKQSSIESGKGRQAGQGRAGQGSEGQAQKSRRGGILEQASSSSRGRRRAGMARVTVATSRPGRGSTWWLTLLPFIE